MNVGTNFFGFRMRHPKFQGPCCTSVPSSKRGRRPDVRIISKAPTWRHILVSWRSSSFCLRQIMYDRVSCNEHAQYFGIRYNRDSTHAAFAPICWSAAPVRHSGGSSADVLLIAFYPLLLSRRSSSLFSNFGPSLTLRYVCY